MFEEQQAYMEPTMVCLLFSSQEKITLSIFSSKDNNNYNGYDLRVN
jgi:hypothetical protein